MKKFVAIILWFSTDSNFIQFLLCNVHLTFIFSYLITLPPRIRNQIWKNIKKPTVKVVSSHFNQYKVES